MVWPVFYYNFFLFVFCFLFFVFCFLFFVFYFLFFVFCFLFFSNEPNNSNTKKAININSTKQHKKPFSQWAKLKSQPKTAKLDKFLEKMSGGEIAEMLSFYLASSKGKPLQVKLNLNHKKFSKVIENIRGQYQDATPNNKRLSSLLWQKT